nr:endonuclease/exonuclease/phosphatase family protein [Micromonospora sp. DSM 115978]
MRPRPWCRATRLLVAAAGGWLLFAVGHRLLSGRWWGWLLPDLLPPIGYLAVPLLMAAALLAARLLGRPVPPRPRAVVLLAVATALGIGLPDAGLHPHALLRRDQAPAGALRIVAWNTGYWDQDDDPDRFLEFLVDQHADVYLLQEYLNWDHAAGLRGAREIDDLDRLRRAFPGFHLVARGELLTLSRFPVLAVVPVSPGLRPDRAAADGGGDGLRPGGPEAGFERVFTAVKVLRTDLRIGSAVLSAYNVHLPVPINLDLDGRFLGFVAERHAARQAHLRELRADVVANPHPVLAAGDLNSSPAMRDLRPLRAELTDAAHAAGPLHPTSWPAGRLPAGWRLDWTLTSEAVRVHRYRFGDPEGLSDHRTQHVSISLEEA